jgi:hypothetical protein
MKLYLNKILWWYKDGIPDEHDTYLIPTIMVTWNYHELGYKKIVYIHFIWLRWVRNIELLFSEKK